MKPLKSLNAEPEHVTSTIMTVGPDRASRWLEYNNSHNRDLRQYRVDQYTRDMLADRWHFNGESIQFDRDDVLLNGQHRLWAIVESGCPQKFVIVRGLDRSAQKTMDQGNKRPPAEQLHLVGIPVGNTVAAAIRTFLRWEQGKFFGDQVKLKTSTSEVVEWAQRNGESVELIRGFISAGLKRTPAPPSIVLATALKFHRIEYDEAADF